MINIEKEFSEYENDISYKFETLLLQLKLFF